MDAKTQEAQIFLLSSFGIQLHVQDSFTRISW
jgi:hypothetical protein